MGYFHEVKEQFASKIWVNNPNMDEMNKGIEAGVCGVTLELLPNTAVGMSVAGDVPLVEGMRAAEETDFVLFLDKDILLARHLEAAGYRVFNSAAAIARCDHKGYTLQSLYHSGIAMPATVLPPFCFANMTPSADDEKRFLDRVEGLGYPLILKEAYGSHGKQVYLIRDRVGLETKYASLRHVPHLYQEFIASSAGRDARLAVVGDRVVAAMLRTSEEDFRANLSLGGAMQPFEPPASFVEMALKAVGLLGLDFAGVDILFGPAGEPVLCEVNSNAHIKNIIECTGVDVAALMLEHILRRIEAI